MTEDLKIKTIRSSLINVILSFFLKALAFGQNIIFARVFLPSELGLLGTALLVASFMLLFSELRFDQFIIRQKENLQRSMDNAFSLYLVTGIISFAALLLMHSHLASWFRDRELGTYLLFLSFMLFSNMLALPSAILIKGLRFGLAKTPDFIDIFTTCAVTLILHSEFGYGIWSLLWGKLGGFAGRYLTLWVLAPYRPRLQIDRDGAKKLMTFGWPLLIGSCCAYFIRSGDQLLVRYFWGNDAFAYYMLAFSLPYYLKELADVSTAATFPAFSELQDSDDKLKETFLAWNKYLATMFIPVGMAIYVFAPSIIHHLYGDKWMPAISLLQLMAIGFTVDASVGFSTGWLAVARGKVRYVMQEKLTNVVILATAGVFFVYQYGPVGGAYYTILQAVSIVLFKKIPFVYAEIKSLSFLWTIWKPLAAAMVAGLCAYVFVTSLTETILLFFGGLISFAGIYLALLLLLDREGFMEIRQISRVLFANGRQR